MIKKAEANIKAVENCARLSSGKNMVTFFMGVVCSDASSAPLHLVGGESIDATAPHPLRSFS